MSTTTFEDREDAGRRLGALVARVLADDERDVVVVGLPRGGVPVAAEVARIVDAPLDVIGVRKLGVPRQPELAMGAIGEGGARVIDRGIVRHAGVSDEELAEVEEREAVELERRLSVIRASHPRRPVEDATVVIVDDGIATGATARAACQVARAHGAARVVLATPVAPQDWIERLADAADDHVAVDTPWGFRAVGHHYVDFAPTSDAAVLRVLDDAARRTS